MTSQITLDTQYGTGDAITLDAQFYSAVALLDDHDSAIGTVGSITGAETTEPVITIAPYDSGEVSGWLMYLVHVFGLNGKQPTIATPMTDTRYESGAVPDPVRRIRSDVWVSGRPVAWLAFDNTVGTNPIVSTMDTAFAGDMEFAMKPRWKYIDTVSMVAYAAASSYAQALPSVTAHGGVANAFNTVTLTSSVPNSAPLTTLQQHAFCLDDTANQPDGGEDKLNFVIHSRAHSSEDQGSFAAWEQIKYYIDGVGADANWFRKHVRIYFYDPNPAGIYYGAERWSVDDAGAEDINRQYQDGDTSSPVVVATKAAILLDIDRVDIFFDYHGFFSIYPGSSHIDADWAGFDNIGGGTAVTETAFRTRLNAAAAHTLTYGLGPATENAELAQHWAKNTLGAQLSNTIELGPEMPGYPDPNSMYGGIAQAVVQAFTAMVANDELVLTGGVLQSDFEFLSAIRTALEFDFQLLSQIIPPVVVADIVSDFKFVSRIVPTSVVGTYPLVGRQHGMEPLSSRRADVSDSGRVRAVDLAEQTAYRIQVQHPLITNAQRDELGAYFIANRTSPFTIALGGILYSAIYERDYSYARVNSQYSNASVTLLATVAS